MLEVEQVPQHKTYLPGYPPELFKIDRQKGKTDQQKETEILILTPMEKVDVSLALNSAASACQDWMKRFKGRALSAKL